MTTQVKVLMLEASDVDNEGVAALVGVVREFRNGHSVTSITEQLAEPLRARNPGSPPPALPSKKPRTYKKREPKPVAAPKGASTGGRTNGVSQLILDGLRKKGRPDMDALARQAYGNIDEQSLLRVKRTIWNLASKGKLKDNKDGSYTVVD